jgi:hypothetical protein
MDKMRSLAELNSLLSLFAIKRIRDLFGSSDP